MILYYKNAENPSSLPTCLITVSCFCWGWMPDFGKTDFSDEKFPTKKNIFLQKKFFLKYSSSASKRGVGDKNRPLGHGDRPLASWTNIEKSRKSWDTLLFLKGVWQIHMLMLFFWKKNVPKIFVDILSGGVRSSYSASRLGSCPRQNHQVWAPNSIWKWSNQKSIFEIWSHPAAA